MFQFADCISSCQIETRAAQKLINHVESHTKMEKRFLFAYETKIFHKQSISHNLIFYFFFIRTSSKDIIIFSRLSVFEILLFLQQSLHAKFMICMTLQVLWIDMI